MRLYSVSIVLKNGSSERRVSDEVLAADGHAAVEAIVHKYELNMADMAWAKFESALRGARFFSYGEKRKGCGNEYKRKG